MRLIASTVALLILLACSPAEKPQPTQLDAEQPKESRPNILLIVADDLGYSDIGAFGGEIATPNLDEIAAQGMILNNFYTGPTCSVSRSMLMSGVDNHIAGLGNMAETVADNQVGTPGYEGHLSRQVSTIAEELSSAGYHTYMSGKWHLGMQPEQSPSNRGFERSFALLFGGGSHFADMAGPDAHRNPSLYRDNGRLVEELPADFYSTAYYTDRLISQIDRDIGDGKPFFAYLAYTAPHWPLQAPDEYLDRYRGEYDVGYDAIRERRFAKQKDLGLFPAATPQPPRPQNVRPWADLTTDERTYHARSMEIYAAMVDYMDMSIGRILDYLAQQDELEDTIIVFISDNGADSWDYDSAPPPVGKFAATFDNSEENRGREGSFVLYGQEWAHVSNTPYTRYKGTTYQGGIRSPAIVHWPRRISGGQVSPALTFVTDWYATFADAAGVDHSSSSGKSLVPLLTGDVEHVRGDEDTIGVEMWGSRGVIGQSFKLVSPVVPASARAKWELYNLMNDPSEQVDLAAEEPDVLTSLQEEWDEYALNNNVILPDGFKVRPPSALPTE